MRIPKLLAALAALVAASGLSLAQTKDSAPVKPPSPEEGASLIRMDLLRAAQGEMASPLRNIFAPGTRASQPAAVIPQEISPWSQDQHAVETAVPAEEAITSPPIMTVNLRYIGFVESAQRMIALVMFEGQAVAVVEGEVVGEGIRIGRVTRDEIEVLLPDSSTRLFSLEGE